MTVATMREQIKDDLVIIGTDQDSQIDTAIRSALRELRQSGFWFLAGEDDLTLLEGDNYLTLPDDFSLPDSFDLIISGVRKGDGKGFDFLSYDDLKSKYWNNSPIQTGTPVACAVRGRKLYFSHIADQDYTIPADYFVQDATLPQATDNSVWFDDGYDVVRSLAQLIFKRDSQQYTATEEDGSMATMQLNSLKRRHEKFEGSR